MFNWENKIREKLNIPQLNPIIAQRMSQFMNKKDKQNQFRSTPQYKLNEALKRQKIIK